MHHSRPTSAGPSRLPLGFDQGVPIVAGTAEPDGGVTEGRAAPLLGDVHTLVDIPTVAEALGVTVRHVRRFVAERRIPHVRVGHFIRFDPGDVRRWIDEHRVTT